jgi:hypothetical protein
MLKFSVAPPRSGKTLFIVQRDIPHYLKIGWNVYHNIPGIDYVKMAYYCGLYPSDVEKQLHYMYSPYIEKFVEENGLRSEADKIGIDRIEEKYYKELSKIYRRSVSEILAYIPTLPKHCAIILDEAQNFIPATDYKEDKNVRFFEYATTHGHQGHDLILATQHEDNVDVKVRRIANLLVYMYRREIIGWFFRNSVSEKHYAGCSAGNPELLNKYTSRYDKRVFGLYRSYIADGITETRKFRSIWFNTKLIVLAVVLLLCLSRVPGFLRTWGIIGKGKAEKIPVEAKEFAAPLEYLGVYSDYYCGRQLYVLRPDGSIEFWEPDGVPESVCPYRNYSPGSNKEVIK